MFGLNLGLNIDCPYWGCLWFPQPLRKKKWRDKISIKPRPLSRNSFQFVNRLNIRKYIRLIYLSIYLFIYSCCCHLEHMASVKCFVSLQFLNLRQSVGLLGWGISLTQGRNLHTITQTQNKRRQRCLKRDSNPWSQCSSGRTGFML
jgi:hypothetical protein